MDSFHPPIKRTIIIINMQSVNYIERLKNFSSIVGNITAINTMTIILFSDIITSMD